MKLINWINSKTKMVDKKDFKYECTYTWATIVFICATIFVYAFIFLMSSLIIFTFVGWHLNTFIPEFTKEYLPQMIDNSSQSRVVFSIFLIILDVGIIFCVYLNSLTPEKMLDFEAKLAQWKRRSEDTCENLFRFCTRPIIWVGNKVSICFDLVLSKLCKQIPKE